MLFHAHIASLDFELGGRRYVVPLGSEVEIPDRVAYAVASRGLLLAPGPAPAGVDGEKSPPVEGQSPGAAHHAAPEPLDIADVAGLATDDAGVDEDPGDEDAAARTLDQLASQGIRLPGRKPGRPRKE